MPRCGWKDGHAESVVWIAADVAFYASFFFGEVSPDEGFVASAGVVVEELQSEVAFGFGRFGYDEQSGGVFVDAVDESYFGVVGVEGGQVAQVPGYGVDECAVEVACAWVYDHAGWLVDDHQVGVFVDDTEGQLFGFDAAVVAWTVEHEGDDVARAYFIITLHRLSAYVYAACVGGFLYAVA